jgi:putative two-component system response regulator
MEAPEMPEATLLIVDDEPMNLSVLAQHLRPTYQVRAASSGEAALRIAASEPRPELILLDVMMPGMDGYEVLERLRSDPATADIPVLFLSALAEAEDEERGLTHGAADYITKPIRPAVVHARVRTQLEAKHARDLLKGQTDALEAEVRRRMRETGRIQAVAVRALARLAEMRDTDTGNHILRTQRYVAQLAQELRDHARFAAELDDASIELLTRSAPLHDIGKVGIPDRVLLKPGPLDDEERALMETHAVIGSEAIRQAQADEDAQLPFLRMAADIARWHHEWWDGSGYPDGLAGDDIPVPARLMAIADVFDALISKRVYKQAFSYDEARDEIAAGRGTHFDPDVADAFLNDFGAFVAIADSLQDEPDDA